MSRPVRGLAIVLWLMLLVGVPGLMTPVWAEDAPVSGVAQGTPVQIPDSVVRLADKAKKLLAAGEGKRAAFYAKLYVRKIGKLFGTDHGEYAKALRLAADVFAQQGAARVAGRLRAQAAAIDRAEAARRRAEAEKARQAAEAAKRAAAEKARRAAEAARRRAEAEKARQAAEAAKQAAAEKARRAAEAARRRAEAERAEQVAAAKQRAEAAKHPALKLDVVRVDGTGEALITGTGPQGWRLHVLKAGRKIAETRINERGRYVLLLPQRLRPGGHRLSLEAVSPDGQHQLRLGQTIIVKLPVATGEGRYLQPYVAVRASDGTLRVVQKGQLPATARPGGYTRPATRGGAKKRRRKLVQRDSFAEQESEEMAAAAQPDDIPPATSGSRSIPGASPAPPVTPVKPAKSEQTNYKVVRIFYGTDRKDLGRSHGVARYGGERGDFSYGVADVSIPRNHKPGELEGPSILRLEFREDPKKHVVLLDVEELSKDVFLGQLKARIKQSAEREALVFVHGYNTSFIDAARRTAQMAHDLRFDGAPIMYSWPSQGTYSGYIVDEGNAAWSVSNLKAFLKDVVRRTGARKLHLIGHSMGNRVLTRAFMKLRAELAENERQRIREVILAAPDIDADVFLRDIVPQITGGPARITLYASARDTALSIAQRIHGSNRAGNIEALREIPQGIDVIDASQVKTSFSGHSFYAESRSILADIRNLIVEGKKITERGYLSRIDSPVGTYWFFKQGS